MHGGRIMNFLQRTPKTSFETWHHTTHCSNIYREIIIEISSWKRGQSTNSRLLNAILPQY
jgi:hypothetical protein